MDVGNKKTLDLDDVPQLDTRDSVVGAFPSFRDKLEADSDANAINSITTLKLVKNLVKCQLGRTFSSQLFLHC